MRRCFSNRQSQKAFRKNLRNNSTSAEAELWKMVKNRKMNGRKFRRQHGLGKYIVDFYCSSEKLIIELDGDSHGDYYRIEKDIEREDFLKSKGYRIIRFENKDVFQYTDFVTEKILEMFNH
jgi:very-short-patch-repair endonuclease